MTMPFSPSRTVFHGNGVATTFPFAFKVWSADQLTVTVTMPGATEQTEEDVTAQCSISLTESGGSVVYLREGSPLPAGAVLSITRDMPFVQEVDLVSASRFDPQVIEDALDQAAAERQQLREGLSRAVKLSATSATTPEDMVEDIFDARDQAEQSATGAAASATAAADSATAAASSATTASQKATTAADSADLASQKATAAADSAANAATQADNAAGSATTATQKAAAAASSATAAAGSATTATQKAAAAASSATAAAGSATTATQKATAAASSATAAAGSATTASQKAIAAADSATAAADSADLSRRWASEDADVPVQSGEYSAKHYAHKAKDAVPDNLVSRVEAVEGKTQSATTSTRGIGRVATAADMVTGATLDNGPAFLSVGSVVTPTPTANAVPQADASGKLDDWITKTDTVAATGTALATQKCAWDTAMQVGTSLLLSTKPSMPGDWQITGVVIGKPLFIVMNRSTPTGIAKLKTISGADGGQGETGTSATSGYVLGYSTDGEYASSNCYIVFPNKETVIIRVIELTAGANIQLKAYQ
ncbi:hypothetical protein [Desulfovibrio legallii]|uniref:Phage tail protein n=1 Tax=Desulfovibrio legallii TaxID=571438 RepID=A0A6H3F4I6_9BACT|nr:hypothetical protein [Desulfovibrio legallii]TBH79473.1 hypothetical protein EB812_07705 [Desulfovibrio legallii]